MSMTNNYGGGRGHPKGFCIFCYATPSKTVLLYIQEGGGVSKSATCIQLGSIQSMPFKML